MNKTNKDADLPSAILAHNSAWKKLNLLQREHFMPDDLQGIKIFRDAKIEDGFLSGASFESCKFINCTFEDTQLQDCYFYGCEFTDCIFESCELSTIKFVEVLFEKCSFHGGLLQQCECADVYFDRVVFTEYRDMIEVRFGGCSYANVQFVRCRLSYLAFESLVEADQRSIDFKWCDISHCSFYWLKLDNFIFDECAISFCTFNNCELIAGTILSNNTTPPEEFNSIDFQTILKSDIPATVLEKQFGIHSSDLKPYVMEMVRKVELHTVFISYSFTDKAFAHRLNDALRARGAFTFLWEKDAPAGQRLKKIMTHNVQKFDKVLFIASRHSLKSEACHFELTNGRIKQDKNWNLALFPIHIDNFLFSVSEEDIPRKNRAEFWMNIEELREIHSMDFSHFAEATDPAVFDQQVDKLIHGLRKEERIQG